MNQATIIAVVICVTVVSVLWYKHCQKKQEQNEKELEDAINEVSKAEEELEEALDTHNLAVIANARDKLKRLREREDAARNS